MTLHLHFLIVLLLTSCVSSVAEVSPDIRAAIAYGKIEDLSEQAQTIEPSLFVRLFRSPVYQEGCFIETEGVCQYRYYFSVATYDEYPETNFFTLEPTGEITAIEWLTDDRVDSATLRIKMNSYTEAALHNNPALNNTPQAYTLYLTPENLIVSQVNATAD